MIGALIMFNKTFLVFFIFFGISISSVGKTIEQIVVTVDDSIILKSELDQYKKFLSSSLFHSSNLLGLYSKNSLIRSKKKLLQYLIDIKVLIQNLPLDQLEKVSREQLLKQELSQKKINDSKLKRFLKKIPMSISKYQDILYYNHLIDKWLQMEILSTIQVSNEALNDHYLRKTGSHFFKKNKYSLNRWSFQGGAEGLKDAQSFLKKTDKSSSTPQEIILTGEQMNSDLKRVILKLNIGQFSSPVCLNNRCFIFELLHKDFVGQRTKSSEKIRGEILNQIFNEKLKKWMEQKRQSSIIKRYF